MNRVHTALSNQNSRTILNFSRTENYWVSRLSHINPYFSIIQSTRNSSRNSDMLHRNCTRQATPHNLEVQKQGSTWAKLLNEVPICTLCFSLTLSSMNMKNIFLDWCNSGKFKDFSRHEQSNSRGFQYCTNPVWKRKELPTQCKKDLFRKCLLYIKCCEKKIWLIHLKLIIIMADTITYFQTTERCTNNDACIFYQEKILTIDIIIAIIIITNY